MKTNTSSQVLTRNRLLLDPAGWVVTAGSRTRVPGGVPTFPVEIIRTNLYQHAAWHYLVVGSVYTIAYV